LAALNIKVERGVRAPIMESKGTPFTEAQEADRVYIFKSGIPNTGLFVLSIYAIAHIALPIAPLYLSFTCLLPICYVYS
jgi:hypothetical protein